VDHHVLKLAAELGLSPPHLLENSVHNVICRGLISTFIIEALTRGLLRRGQHGHGMRLFHFLLSLLFLRLNFDSLLLSLLLFHRRGLTHRLLRLSKELRVFVILFFIITAAAVVVLIP
jgi:hypothetical protein